MKKLNEIMQKLEKQDNLSIIQILKMDLFEYKLSLIKRAQEIVNSEKNQTNKSIQ